MQANDWNDRGNVEKWRKSWADICNRYLSVEQQIDHRSYERQGIPLEPTVHEGFRARQMEQRGILYFGVLFWCSNILLFIDVPIYSIFVIMGL